MASKNEALVRRARDLLARVAHLLTEDGETAVVEASRFDGVLFDEALAASPRLLDAMWGVQRRSPYASDLYRDLFAFFYQANPVLRAASAMKPSRWANTKLLHLVESMPESLDVRWSTRHDAMATAAVIAQLNVQWWMDSIEPDPLGALFDLAWRVEAGLDGEGSLSAALLDELEQAAEAAEADDPGAQPRGPGQGLRSALAASLEVAKADAQDMAAGRSAFGLDDATMSSMSMAEHVHLAELLSSHALKQWLRLLGQLMSAAASPTVRAGRERLSGVRLSDDVAQMVASEVAMSVHPVLRLEHLARLADAELLTNDYTGPTGKGPVIVVVDESSSMTGAGAVSPGRQAVPRRVWATAFTLAVAARMRSEGRPLRIVSFSSANKQRVWGDTPGDLIAFGNAFLGGGTAFEPALEVAAALVAELSSSPSVTADIVLVTDDDRESPSATWLARWAQLSSSWRTFGVAVGVDTGQALRAICEETVSVKDFLDTDGFSSVVSRL